MKSTLLALLTLSLCLPSHGIAATSNHYRVQRSMEQQQKLHAAYLAKGLLYRPRTEHFKQDGTPRYINRLILEDSPYLLQHAHNPVDWHAWGEEAFAKAKRENKPIFLSIGYSTCHWCHVMERESFENPAIAGMLNEHFVAIKVDRESRPDIDEIYMTAVVLMNGHGGWPMSSFLTPDGKPFYGGTYYAPQQFAQLVLGVNEAWQERRDEVIEQANRIAEGVTRSNSGKGASKKLALSTIEAAVKQIVKGFDELQGGFTQAPKFPHEPWLFLLLNQVEFRQDAEVLNAVEVTLDAMARGGIHDQIGGGFHRYSVDNEWLVPHFEKMLYNQAHLARIYLQAWRLTGKERYRRTAAQTLDYVLREMTDPQGRFYSATDADSEGEEGAFFVWTPAQIRAALPPKDAELVLELYNVSDNGNFEGNNIPHLSHSLLEFAAAKGMSVNHLRNELDRINNSLRRIREKREHPLRDDKIVTAWNGMMLSAFAQAALIIDSKKYAEAAEKAAGALWRSNRKSEGRLWRIHLDGRSSIAATLEDYAYLAEGLLHLYDLGGNRIWLRRAQELTDAAVKRFSVLEGDFYISEADSTLGAMGRPRDNASDNAAPSASSVMLHNLQRLWIRTGNHDYKRRADALIAALASRIERTPNAFAYLLTGFGHLNHGERSNVAYAARGGIRIAAKPKHNDNNELHVAIEIDIPDGWHINADRPLSNKLIATAVSLRPGENGWTLSATDYPKPIRQQFDFQSGPLLVFQGKTRITAKLRQGNGNQTIKTLPLDLTLQACSDKICLPPEQLTLSVSLN